MDRGAWWVGCSLKSVSHDLLTKQQQQSMSLGKFPEGELIDHILYMHLYFYPP